MVKNLPSTAGDTGVIPAGGTKVPQSVEQLSPRSTTKGVCMPQLEKPHPMQCSPSPAPKQTKYNKLVTVTKKKQTHKHRAQTSGSEWGEGREEGNRGEGDQQVQTLVYKISHRVTHTTQGL